MSRQEASARLNIALSDWKDAGGPTEEVVHELVELIQDALDDYHAEERARWCPIERKPPTDQLVLFYGAARGNMGPICLGYMNSEGYTYDDIGHMVMYPTHWMKLPEAPQ